MGVSALEHITIRCAQLQRTRDFYVELLGLEEGARPAFPFRGYWLYLGGIPVVHLVEASDKASAWGGEIVIARPGDGTGCFDHVAFRGDDGAAMKVRLDRAGRSPSCSFPIPKACWSRSISATTSASGPKRPSASC